MEMEKLAGGDLEKIALLESLVTPGPFHYIDIHFARLVCRLVGDEGCWPLFLAALLTSYAVNRRRQICLPLRELPSKLSEWLLADNGSELNPESATRLAELVWPPNWEIELSAHVGVASPENAALLQHLLVLDDGRLYLQRYWDYEQRLARMINERLQAPAFAFLDPDKSLGVVAPRFAGESGVVNADVDVSGVPPSFNFQTAAVCAGLRNHFTIISGGPGCGKTSVVAAVAALWLESRPKDRIVLCAPTGLAQARLYQALLDEIDFLDCTKQVKDELLKLSAATIHRLLGYRPGRGFRYHGENRLPVDLLIVDEASMVPLWIMTSLFAALPDACAVILLGDKNQLASVEAGAVLGDLCSSGSENRFSAAFLSDVARLTMRADGMSAASEKGLLDDHIIELKKSYRFAPDGGIARLQRAIMAPAAANNVDLEQLCAYDPSGEVGMHRLPGEGPVFEAFLFQQMARLEVEIRGRIVPVKSYSKVDDLATAFAIFQAFRILSPLRRGRFGVENLNRLLPQALGLQANRQYYRGRPLMITRNAPQLNLYNGDIGLVWPDAEGRLKVWFRRADGSFADFLPQRLPSHESAFAVTVHKAQGSGFQRVLLLWPGSDSALLTREMLYTAVTRAAKRIEIWLSGVAPGRSGSEASLAAFLTIACRRRVERSSGLLKTLQEME
ncbi:MAG: exodeoxyribonuclease V subunit alpha [Pseudomonadota bacterium]|nr:exodeoxyribonuclease V subunit alpha [Pseudomonadota bacterium]